MRYVSLFEAKDLSKHPELKRQERKLIAKLERDRTFGAFGLYYDDMEPIEAFVKLTEAWMKDNAIRNRMTEHFNVSEDEIRKYFGWIVMGYTKGNFSFEDIPTIIATLGLYQVFKRKGNLDSDLRDINRLSYEDLKYMIRHDMFNLDVLDAGENEDKKQKILANKEAEVHYEDSKVIVYTVKSSKACTVLGSNNWCTSYSSGAFERYGKSGKLFIVEVKNSTEKYHISFEPGNLEFKDKNNDDFDYDVVKRYNFGRIFPGSLFDPNASQQVKARAIRENIGFLAYMNPSAELVEFAIRTHINEIALIVANTRRIVKFEGLPPFSEWKTEWLIMLVEEDPWAIDRIPGITDREEVVLAAIDEDPSVTEVIYRRISKETILKAIKRSHLVYSNLFGIPERDRKIFKDLHMKLWGDAVNFKVKLPHED